jgi:hypothetical protein
MGNGSKKANWVNGTKIRTVCPPNKARWEKIKAKAKNPSPEFAHQIERHLKGKKS